MPPKKQKKQKKPLMKKTKLKSLEKDLKFNTTNFPKFLEILLDLDIEEFYKLKSK